jgi:peptidoglycan hydrolase CwlO-like protein
MRRATLLALVSVAVTALAACGGGSGGGGGSGTGDLQAEAAQVGALLDRVEALPTTATTDQEFMQQLGQIRAQVQTEIENVADADAPEELESERDKLSNRLRSLRTQLGRVQGLAAGGDVESAKTAMSQLLSVAEIRDTIETIESSSSSG